MSADGAAAPDAPVPATPRRSMATRARLYLLGAALIALVAAFALFAIDWSQFATGQRADELSRQVAALAKGQAASGQLQGASASTADRLFRVEAGLIGAALFVTDERGTVQRSSVDTPPASIPLPLLTTRADGQSATGVLRNATGEQVLVVASAIDETHALVAVQSLAEIRAAQLGMLAVAAAALLAAAVITYVAGGVLARRFSAPIVRLQSAAEQVAGGALGTQVAEEGDAETASLARSFNRMSTRVAEAYDAQKAFVGDVSHEIRTPLTSIRGFAEAMLDGTLTGPEQQTRALTVIRDEATRISEVSQTLLALSELDAGAVEIARVTVDVSQLADALLSRFAGSAAEARLTLDVALGEARPLGDPDRLLQALSALVGNALAYTPAGGTVRVSAQADAQRWRVAVDDSGPGIPAEARDEVFRRFARLDRSRSAKSGGAGLGLAIAQRLVELMGGDIALAESDLGGARFTIELPIAG